MILVGSWKLLLLWTLECAIAEEGREEEIGIQNCQRSIMGSEGAKTGSPTYLKGSEQRRTNYSCSSGSGSEVAAGNFLKCGSRELPAYEAIKLFQKTSDLQCSLMEERGYYHTDIKCPSCLIEPPIILVSFGSKPMLSKYLIMPFPRAG